MVRDAGDKMADKKCSKSLCPSLQKILSGYSKREGMFGLLPSRLREGLGVGIATVNIYN